MGYSKQAFIGISWMTAFRGISRVIATLRGIILARILLPSQFGAYGVALLALGFLEVMTETGINVILIQEKEVEKYINSAWIVSIIRGIIISVIIVILTPLISLFFNSPDSKILLYAISIVPFLRGFINPSVVKFQKELNFHIEFCYRFVIFSIDATVGIIASVITHNPLGIIIGFIVGVILELILSFIIVKPTPFFDLQRGYISKIFHRGKWVTAGGIFNYLFHNTDNIIVGRMLGITPLGLYQMAYSFSIIPITEIADVFARVTFPVYTKIAGDTVRLHKAFIKTTLIITLLALPFGLLLYFFPKEITSLILGEKWFSLVPILPVLGIFGVIRAISGSSSSLFLAVGKQEYVTIVTLVSIAGLIIPIIPLVLYFGLFGAALSALIGAFIAVPFYLYYIIKIFKGKNENR